jgi:adenosylcobinamide-GDP ribazoletransferase
MTIEDDRRGMFGEQGPAPEPSPPRWPGWLAATATCLRFFSRLPVPRLPGERDIHAAPDFRLVLSAMPLAALVMAAPAALFMLAAGLAGVSAPLAASLAVTALVLTTGALHEDGLADTADGLFGGSTPERRLEIMRDSRIGSYGALALGLSLLLRVTALAAILTAAAPWAAAAAILCSAMWSRSECVRILATVPPARPDGKAASVGRPEARSMHIAMAGALGLASVLTLAADQPIWTLFVGLALSAGAVELLLRNARRLIGGQTGDIIGAAQQLSEIAIYLGFALMLGGSGR